MIKTLDIYGIGNALVDTEIPISDTDFSKLNLDKGTMSLIESDHLQKQLRHFSASKKLDQAAGGSAANSIYAAAKLGATCAFSGLVAKDEAGEFFIQDLEQLDIAAHVNQHQDDKTCTGCCLAYIHDDAQRTFETHLGAASLFTAKDLNTQALEQAKITYCEGFLFSTDTGYEACLAVNRQAKGKVALTLSDVFMVQAFKSRFEAFFAIKKVSYLFCNEAEALAYSNQKNIDDAAQYLLNSCETLVMTLGAEGVAIYQAGHPVMMASGLAVNAINTNGAGDAFAGAFLAAIVKEKTVEQAAQLGNQAAAEVVQVSGPRLQNTSNLLPV
eukprot:COSAG01_NODE_6_length_54687_cov_500.907599_33_plen_328_part_00